MLLVGIEVDHAHGLPVARGTAPALGIGGLGRFIDVRALCQQRAVLARMALVRRDETNGAVSMFEVVPVHKRAHPLARGQQRLECTGGVVGPVFQGFKK